MVAQILAYLVIIGITTISAIAMIFIADDCIESDRIIFNILGGIFDGLSLFTFLITLFLLLKCLWLCWNIIF